MGRPAPRQQTSRPQSWPGGGPATAPQPQRSGESQAAQPQLPPAPPGRRHPLARKQPGSPFPPSSGASAPHPHPSKQEGPETQREAKHARIILCQANRRGSGLQDDSRLEPSRTQPAGAPDSLTQAPQELWLPRALARWPQVHWSPQGQAQAQTHKTRDHHHCALTSPLSPRPSPGATPHPPQGTSLPAKGSHCLFWCRGGGDRALSPGMVRLSLSASSTLIRDICERGADCVLGHGLPGQPLYTPAFPGTLSPPFGEVKVGAGYRKGEIQREHPGWVICPEKQKSPGTGDLGEVRGGRGWPGLSGPPCPGQSTPGGSSTFYSSGHRHQAGVPRETSLNVRVRH